MSAEEKPNLLSRFPLGKDFLIIWGGQSFSVLGDEVQALAIVWWLATGSGKSVVMAGLALSFILPRLVLFPVVGTFADKWDKRAMMVVADFARAVLVAGLALAMWQKWLGIITLYIANMLLVTLGSLHAPVLEAAIPLVATKAHLARANSLLQLSMYGARLAGPVLAGSLIPHVGVPPLVMFNSLTFFVSGITLFFVRVPRTGAVRKQRFWVAFREGFKYMVGFRIILYLALLLAMGNLFLTSYDVLFALVITRRFANSSQILGLTSSLFAGASIVSSTLLATLGARQQRRLLGLSLSYLALGIGYILIGTLQQVEALGFGVVVLGAAFPSLYVISQTIFQSSISAQYLGRVLATRRMISGALQPVGMLLAGILGDSLGPGNTLALAGVGLVLLAPFFARKGWENQLSHGGASLEG